MRVFSATESVCPVCLRVIPAERGVGDDGYIHMRKTCPEHGSFDVLLWEGGIVDYLKWDTAGEGGNRPPVTVPAAAGCPNSCGLCENHESAGCCVLLELTDRCNLHCPVCFASAGDGQGRDLTHGEIARLYDMLLERGGPFNIQLSGGEPATTCPRSSPSAASGASLISSSIQTVSVSPKRRGMRKSCSAGASPAPFCSSTASTTEFTAPSAAGNCSTSSSAPWKTAPGLACPSYSCRPSHPG